MCNIDKIQSTFRHKGQKYRALFDKDDNQISVKVEREVYSVMGVSFWRELDSCNKQTLDDIDVSNIEKESNLVAVKKLRECAKLCISPNII